MKNQNTGQMTGKQMKWIVLGAAFAGSLAYAQMPQQPQQPPETQPGEPPHQAPPAQPQQAQPGQPQQAQPGQPQQAQPTQPIDMEQAAPATPEVTDAQLTQAVTAYISVSEIQTRVQEQLSGVEDQAVIQEAVTQARTDMIEAVQDAGMAPAQYEEVMNVVTQDESVRNRFLAILQEEQTGG